MKIVSPSDAFVSQFEQCFNEKILVSLDYLDYSTADLILFTGGEDINPALYNNSVTYSVGINKRRDNNEISILNFIRQELSGKHILGVCRGLQLIMVRFGATLVQDLYMEMKLSHNFTHTLEFHRKHFIVDHLQNKVVNSMHHQGVHFDYNRYVGENFNIIATHKSILECVESRENPNNYFLTQFHPEFMNDPQFFENIKEWTKIKGEKYTPDKKKKEVYSGRPPRVYRQIGSQDGTTFTVANTDFTPVESSNFDNFVRQFVDRPRVILPEDVMENNPEDNSEDDFDDDFDDDDEEEGYIEF